MPNDFKIELVCLLAGHSKRMGTPKQHVIIAGKTFLEHILKTVGFLANRLGNRFFVGQDWDEQSEAAVNKAGGVWLVNHNPDEGPLSSIRIAMKQGNAGSGILLWPIDHPLVSLETVTAVLDEAERFPKAIVTPSDGIHRGHPSCFPAWARDDLWAAPLEAGARWVIRKHETKIRHVITSDSWILRNLNNPEQLPTEEKKAFSDKREGGWCHDK